MSLVSLKELLETANKNNFAVGYFEAWDLYSLEAVALAAEKENSPIVLGFGAMTVNQEWINSFGIEPLGRYANELAKSLSVPAAVYLNEVYEIDHAKRGIKSGFNTQTKSSKGLWEKYIKETNPRAIGYYHNPATVYGIMKNVIPAVGLGAGYGVLNNEQTPQYKMGGTIQGTNKISNFGYGGFIGNMNNYQIPMTTQNLYY